MHGTALALNFLTCLCFLETRNRKTAFLENRKLYNC